MKDLIGERKPNYLIGLHFRTFALGFPEEHRKNERALASYIKPVFDYRPTKKLYEA